MIFVYKCKNLHFLCHKKFLKEEFDKRIIIAHDESTFRSGDVQSFQWLHEKYSPLFNNGRGVSRMISDFIVAQPEMTCFQLTEYKDALKENPELENESYIERKATSIIEPTINCYFTNETILKQFKQLLISLKYSKIFKDVNYRVDILVDNATTHTKALVDVSMFNKSIDTHCGIDKLYWTNQKNEIKSN